MRGFVPLPAIVAREVSRDLHSYHGSYCQVASITKEQHEVPAYPAAVAIDRATSDLGPTDVSSVAHPFGSSKELWQRRRVAYQA